MSLQKFILTSFGVLIIAMLITWATYQARVMKNSVNDANSTHVKQQTIEATSELYDLNDSILAGSKVVSLIKKYGSDYSIRVRKEVDDEDVSSFINVTEAISVIDKKGSYKCSLQLYDNETSSYSNTGEIDRVAALLFEKQTTKQEAKQINYSPLLNFLEKQNGDATQITQTDVDTLADYITLLNDKNIKLEQNQFYGAQGKLSRHSSWVMPENDVQIANSQVDFVPTDIIVWQDDGVGYYTNLIGLPGNTTVLTTGIDGVSIKLERSVGTVTKVTVINDTDTDLNVKVYRVGK